MPLELHIWGPAFGLPCIDAECLACISYLRQCGVEKEDWVLIPSSDPSVSPTRELPALKSGTLWISRYRNIVDYLKQYSDGEWDPDHELDKQQQADSIAFSSFLESRALPLLDLSLYVSSENYTTVTRATLSSILPWPRSWTLPPTLRTQAKKRSVHLGLSALDIDSAKDGPDKDGNMTAQIPKSLRKPKETISSILGKGAAKSQFRLDAVTEDFFAPMDELLGEKPFFLGDETTGLDCLAVGYLALMLKPDVSHDWLRHTLKDKYPKLTEWTNKMIAECFNNEHLPWREPETPTIAGIAYTVLDNLVDSVPIVGAMRTNGYIKLSSQELGIDDYEARELALAARNRNRDLYSQIVAVTGGIGAFVGYLFWVGMIKIPRRAANGGRRDFGTAGAMLGLR